MWMAKHQEHSENLNLRRHFTDIREVIGSTDWLTGRAA